MDSKKLRAIAEDVFAQEANKGLNEVHVTSDGTAFITKNDANNHANGLKEKEVITLKRDHLKDSEESKDSDDKNKKSGK